MKKYEVVVIGAGPAGYQAAIELGKAGVKTLLIEKSKERVGGTCLNVGCIPTKNYLYIASFVSKLPYFEQCGLSFDFKGLNLEQLKAKTTTLITEIRTGVLWMLEQAHVELLYGSASFADEKTVEVDGEKIGFKKCIIATGSKVRELSELPLDSKFIISSSDVFNLTTLPKSLAIIGTGSIGCEFATFFSSFGVEVTLIGRSSQLLSTEDEDVSTALLRAFEKLNIKVITSATIANAELTENGVKLFLNESLESITCELVLSAIGRIPNTGGLNIGNTNVKLDEKGFIEVSPSFMTSQENIYALGDSINTPAFAHTAYAEAKIVSQNIVRNASKTNTHITPFTIFTNPQIASCGLRKKAKAKGLGIDVKKAYFKVNAKAKILGDDTGFAKLIVSATNGVILGATVIGVEATEIIQELVFAVEKKLTITELKEVIHAHPTVSEIISYL